MCVFKGIIEQTSDREQVHADNYRCGMSKVAYDGYSFERQIVLKAISCARKNTVTSLVSSAKSAHQHTIESTFSKASRRLCALNATTKTTTPSHTNITTPDRLQVRMITHIQAQ